jgi:POT family proton-dependent oligopeptide transporter
MLVGLVQYTLGAKRMGDAGLYPVPAANEAEAAKQKRLLLTGILSIAGLAIVFGLLALAGVVTPVRIANIFGVLLLATVVGSFGSMIFSPDWTPVERKRIIVTFVMFLAASLFWSEFEQAGSTLNLFADRSTRNEILGFSFPASWLQSVQALFIIIFAPIFAWLWLKLGRRDPSSPVKFSLGLIFVGVSFALMAAAAILASNGTLVSPMWLIVTYLLHTFGELCLSPVGLSAMTKLAPARVAGLVMGMWFLSNATGNYLGGRLASFYESFPLPNLFGLVAVTGIAAGFVMFAMTPLIKRLMGGVK